MNTFSHVPPGFRFHPTDEELVDYYLRRKINSRSIDLDVIKDVDLYKIEPWDLQELCRLGTEEQNEWYFFSHKDKKYPTGTRTNRATTAGFWKATGRDKAIYSKLDLIGMRKTLVFYKGRAPNGQKSDWIMHEYRLETDENGTPQEEGWVVCRVFKKRVAATMRRLGEHESPCWYDDQMSFMPDLDSPTDHNNPPPPHQSNHINNTVSVVNYHRGIYPNCKKELGLPFQISQENLLQLPFIIPSSGCTAGTTTCLVPPPNYGTTSHDINPAPCSTQLKQDGQTSAGGSSHNINHHHNMRLPHSMYAGNNNITSNNPHQHEDGEAAADLVATDWRAMDKFVASQLSQGDRDISRMNDQNNNYVAGSTEMVAPGDSGNLLVSENAEKREGIMPERASISSASASQVDIWKYEDN